MLDRATSTAASSVACDGVVKWFNAEKGYGFVKPKDGGRDVLLHISALKDAGQLNISEGTLVVYETGFREGKGSFVAKLISIGTSPATAKFHREEEDWVRTTVKWFKKDKGYGFLAPGDGLGDLFIHLSVVERCGETDLSQGQSVEAKPGKNKRSGRPEALEIRMCKA